MPDPLPPFVPPVLDTTPFTRDQLAAITTELARLVGLNVAANRDLVEAVRLAMDASPIDGLALGTAYETWFATAMALHDRSLGIVAGIAGQAAPAEH